MKRTSRNHGATFKSYVALSAGKGDKTVVELAEQFSVHPTQITDWRQQLLACAADVFWWFKTASPDLKMSHAKIGQLALENDFREGALTQAGVLSVKR